MLHFVFYCAVNVWMLLAMLLVNCAKAVKMCHLQVFHIKHLDKMAMCSVLTINKALIKVPDLHSTFVAIFENDSHRTAIRSHIMSICVVLDVYFSYLKTLEGEYLGKYIIQSTIQQTAREIV